MKQLIVIVLLLSALSINAQRTITTSNFSFQCNCTEVENSYNAKNKSYNYSYETNDTKTVYMISVKINSIDQEGFLHAIKNSGTFNYKDTSFKGLKAISTDMQMNGQYVKHIGFFRKDKGFIIIIATNSKEALNNLYTNFSKSFKFK